MSEPLLLQLDCVLRGAALSLLLLLAGLLCRGSGRHPASRLAAGLAFGMAAWAISGLPGFAGWGLAFRLPVSLLAAISPVLFWLLSATLFDEEFRLSRRHAVAGATLMALEAASLATEAPLGLLPVLAPVGLAGMAATYALDGWETDLVGARRTARLFVILTAAIVPLGIGFTAWASLTPSGAAINAAGAAFLVAAVTAGAWWLLYSDHVIDLTRGGRAIDRRRVAVDITDPALLRALERLMAVDRAYRQSGLTPAALAQRLKIPVQRLRRVIHAGLGYRDFEAFLNRYRIAEAKIALADEVQLAVPVDIIGLDAGFIEPEQFEAAFRAETGLAPRAFRRLAMTHPLPRPQDTEEMLGQRERR